jgi:ribosomal protein S11
MDQGRYELQSDDARRYLGMGREEARRTLALRVLAEGMPVSRVAALTDLPEDEVRNLQH